MTPAKSTAKPVEEPAVPVARHAGADPSPTLGGAELAGVQIAFAQHSTTAPAAPAALTMPLTAGHVGVSPLNPCGGAEYTGEQIAFSEHVMTARGNADRGH